MICLAMLAKLSDWLCLVMLPGWQAMLSLLAVLLFWLAMQEMLVGCLVWLSWI